MKNPNAYGARIGFTGAFLAGAALLSACSSPSKAPTPPMHISASEQHVIDHDGALVVANGLKLYAAGQKEANSCLALGNKAVCSASTQAAANLLTVSYVGVGQDVTDLSFQVTKEPSDTKLVVSYSDQNQAMGTNETTVVTFDNTHSTTHLTSIPTTTELRAFASEPGTNVREVVVSSGSAYSDTSVDWTTGVVTIEDFQHNPLSVPDVASAITGQLTDLAGALSAQAGAAVSPTS